VRLHYRLVRSTPGTRRFGFSSHARTEASTVVSSSEYCKCWRIGDEGREREKEEIKRKREKKERNY